MNTPVNKGVRVSVSAALALILTTLVATAVQRSSNGSPYVASDAADVAQLVPIASTQMAGRA